MGMDLVPINPSEDAPRWDVPEMSWHGEVISGRYSWAGWSELCGLLKEWGVPTEEFDCMNEGKMISEETCIRVAEAIEQHLPELPADYQEWLQPHIELWRTCGGYKQC
jgi:hypothetical protein